jgi:hypothetical protein
MLGQLAAGSNSVRLTALQHKSPEDSTVVLAFAVVSIVVLFIFGIYKLCINQYVESKALEQGGHECWCTQSFACCAAWLSMPLITATSTVLLSSPLQMP